MSCLFVPGRAMSYRQEPQQMPSNFSFEHESALLESLEYLNKSFKDEMINDIYDLRAIRESMHDRQLLTEASVSIFAKFREWIREAIEWLRVHLMKFFDSLKKYLSKKSFVKGSLNILKSFPPQMVFRYNGYKYSLETNDTPAAPLLELKDDIRSLVMIFSSANIAKDTRKIVNILNSKKTSRIFDDFDASMDYYRGMIFNDKRRYIDKESFVSTCRAHFRYGETEATILNIDKSYINTIIPRLEDGYKKLEREISIERRNVEDVYNTVIKLTNIIENKIGEGNVNISDEDDYDNLITVSSSLLGTYIRAIKSVHSSIVAYFAAKIDAVRSAAVQDNNIAYKAIRCMKEDQ